MLCNLRKMGLALEDQLHLRKLSLPIHLHKQREASSLLSGEKVRRRKKVGNIKYSTESTQHQLLKHRNCYRWFLSARCVTHDVMYISADKAETTKAGW